MLPSNAHNTELGFNLVEISAVTLLVGILASVTAPGLLAMYQQFEADDGFNQLRGALQQAQMQAIRRSQDCTVTLDTTNKEITGDPGCLLETRELPDSVTINHTGANTITFNIRGGTGDGRTIVVSDPQQSQKKCLVIAPGIGIMRSGNYTGDIASPISSASCTTF